MPDGTGLTEVVAMANSLSTQLAQTAETMSRCSSSAAPWPMSNAT
jgi:hypothetical protein